ncbi:MAG: FkbM family methyltransferase [Okeania sp. SIO3I5]|uniref:FkbM family methyltransferase n=1 Tax=Okeania sp. SIO3I5 TaxID=2607805 RepID=UPI0013B7C299|nr:FkbM family methyltransferase [Okeania sp. SIO3I5]NEQ40209.1 FkbM family methyltransferase [Okeania sp. SIO3I5]
MKNQDFEPQLDEIKKIDEVRGELKSLQEKLEKTQESLKELRAQAKQKLAGANQKVETAHNLLAKGELEQAVNIYQKALIFEPGLKKLSKHSLAQLKSAIKIVGKLDYHKKDIFLLIDSAIEMGRLNSCRKEEDTVVWMETFLKPGEIMYDIGANVGAYSLVAAKLYEDPVKVYAFEPACDNFLKLCKNISFNKCTHNAFPFGIALSDETKVEIFNYKAIAYGGSHHALGKPVNNTHEEFKPALSVPTISWRIDDLIEQMKFPVPNHIKIDVDSIEFEILKGAEKTLSNPQVKSINVEQHEQDVEKVIEMLDKKNFRLNSEHQRTTKHMKNYVFVRN